MLVWNSRVELLGTAPSERFLLGFTFCFFNGDLKMSSYVFLLFFFFFFFFFDFFFFVFWGFFSVQFQDAYPSTVPVGALDQMK